MYCKRVISLLSFKTMNFHLYLIYLLSWFGSGSSGVAVFASSEMAALFTVDMKNSDHGVRN